MLTIGAAGQNCISSEGMACHFGLRRLVAKRAEGQVSLAVEDSGDNGTGIR